MFLNIVIPVLNEEGTLKYGIETTVRYLDQTDAKDKYIITIADNGSTDRTEEIAQELCSEYDNVRYLRVSQKGVGIAFREAIKKNTCEVIGYMDVDLATDIRYLEQVFHLFTAKTVRIVVGSRLMTESKVYNRALVREITSRGLNIILKILLKVKFTDAMCGFKFYASDVANSLVEVCSDNNGWFYCAEMMIRAEWMGIPITELPVEWHDDPATKVRIVKLSISYLKEIGKLYREKRRNRN